MISGIIITILIILLLPTLYMLYLALKRINQYEELILNITNVVEFISGKIKTIDDSGHFEADDEIGFFFDEIKKMDSLLSSYFENEGGGEGVGKKEDNKQN